MFLQTDNPFKNKIMKNTFVLVSLLFLNTVFSQGFLKQKDQKIVNEKGENVILRGLGLGGWMVQEGYMLKTSDFAGPQHKIKAKITELVGEKNTTEFYDAYLKHGITKRDIDSLASWGFNSVRLPMHYNLYTLSVEEEKIAGKHTWLDKGFQMTDELLSWCADNKMYLILDLHAAPGGQGKDANISDYDTTKPSLWESKANQDKMIAFWKKIAERYKDNPWIGAYDIVNEPNWNFTGTNQNGCDEKLNAPLRALQVAITKAIREVDKNHLIVIEGNCWGNNYNGMFPLWDDNMALSFHKYWNKNTQESIQQLLDYRQKYNVPIWLGESGENSNVWFKDAISLVERNNIGWAFWPMKKVENIAGVTSVIKNQEYNVLLNYWKNGGEKPSQAFAKKALMQLAENYKMENVVVKTDVIDAMFRQVQTEETKPYKRNILPKLLFATEYDLGNQGAAYFDTDFVNYKVDTGIAEQWNKGNKMRNDGVDIIDCKDEKSNGYAVSYIEDGEWLLFTVHSKQTKKYTIQIRYASDDKEGIIYLESENQSLTDRTKLPVTGSVTNWKTVTIPDVELQSGSNKIKLIFEKGGFHLNYLSFQ